MLPAFFTVKNKNPHRTVRIVQSGLEASVPELVTYLPESCANIGIPTGLGMQICQEIKNARYLHHRVSPFL